MSVESPHVDPESAIKPLQDRTGSAPPPEEPRRRTGPLALFLILLVALIAIVAWRTGLVHALSHKDQLIAMLRGGGVRGALVCIGVQFLQVVIFIIPGEITQFASGYVFGAWRGFLYSVVGIMLGSAFNFYFARVVGRPALERLLGRSSMKKADDLLNGAKGKSAIFLLFLIPGTPKDAMCYGAGFCSMGLVEFVVITGLARAPAMLSSILLGSQAFRRDYRAMFYTALIAGLAIAFYYLYERWRKSKTPSR